MTETPSQTLPADDAEQDVEPTKDEADGTPVSKDADGEVYTNEDR